MQQFNYNQFLAFVLIYAAEANIDVSEGELEYIRTRTGIEDITPIKELVDSLSDAEIIDRIAEFRKQFLDTPEKEKQVRTDLENMLSSNEHPNQFEKAVVHIIERIL